MTTTAALIAEDLTLQQGDTLVKEYTFSDQAGALITDATAVCSLCVKRAVTDADPGVFVVQATGISAGVFFLTISPSNTSGLTPPAVLLYDTRVKETSGRITTVARGKFTVLAPVHASP